MVTPGAFLVAFGVIVAFLLGISRACLSLLVSTDPNAETEALYLRHKRLFGHAQKVTLLPIVFGAAHALAPMV